MKLAEALIQRSDTQKRIEQLRQRLITSAKVQEDEKPPEDPQELLIEMEHTIEALKTLIQRINRTNAVTQFDESRTLTDALAERESLMLQRSILVQLADAAKPVARYGRMEIKMLPTVNISELQKRADDLARQYRELDTAIQQLNWNVDLLE